MQMRISSRFVAKGAAAAALVIFGDWLFWAGRGVGSNLGSFALAWTIVTLALTRSRGATDGAGSPPAARCS